MINNKRSKHLIDKNKELVEQNKALKATIKSNGLIMDKAKPILDCVIPYILDMQSDIEADIEGFGSLQPALDAMLEFEESKDV